MQVTDTQSGLVAKLNTTEANAFRKVAGLMRKLSKLEDDGETSKQLAEAAEHVRIAAHKYGAL